MSNRPSAACLQLRYPKSISRYQAVFQGYQETIARNQRRAPSAVAQNFTLVCRYFANFPHRQQVPERIGFLQPVPIFRHLVT